jgi:DNA damage-inducible protein 1
MRLVDKRYAGTAVGVGSCKILGKIHAVDIEIEGKFLTCAFTIIENNSVEFLLGLDMLKRFSVIIYVKKCLIDLKKNELNF